MTNIRSRLANLEKASHHRKGPLKFFRVQGGSPGADPEAFVRSLGHEVGENTRLIWRPILAPSDGGPVRVDMPMKLLGAHA